MYWAPTLKWEWLNSNFGILSYPLVKAHIMASTARASQVIQHYNNHQQAADEMLGPYFQDYILCNTIRDIDNHLTKHIQTHYKLKIAAVLPRL